MSSGAGRARYGFGSGGVLYAGHASDVNWIAVCSIYGTPIRSTFVLVLADRTGTQCD